MSKKLSSFFEELPKKCPTKQSVEKKCQIVSVKKCNDLKEERKACQKEERSFKRIYEQRYGSDSNDPFVGVKTKVILYETHAEIYIPSKLYYLKKIVENMPNTHWDANKKAYITHFSDKWHPMGFHTYQTDKMAYKKFLDDYSFDFIEVEEIKKETNTYNPRKNPIDFLTDYHEGIISQYEMAKRRFFLSTNEQRFLDDMARKAWYKRNALSVTPKQASWINNIMKRYYGKDYEGEKK